MMNTSEVKQDIYDELREKWFQSRRGLNPQRRKGGVTLLYEGAQHLLILPQLSLCLQLDMINCIFSIEVS